MPIYRHHNGLHIHYQIDGAPGAPTLVFVNGLTQATRHWVFFREHFKALGWRVIVYDLVGQGESSKPVLGSRFEENADVLAALLRHLEVDQAYIAGISFGGIIVLRFAIDYPELCAGIVPMSTFSEMNAQAKLIGANLFVGMARVGFEYLIDLLMPLNFSNAWIEENWDALTDMKRLGASANSIFAIQNLMESLRDFQGFTGELGKIRCPTLILNGEYDAFTTRHDHELLRRHIRPSRLVFMQHVHHAFTLEIPELTARVIRRFVEQVESGEWRGDRSVWIANDNPKRGPVFYPYQGDHTRAIAVPKPPRSRPKRRASATIKAPRRASSAGRT